MHGEVKELIRSKLRSFREKFVKTMPQEQCHRLRRISLLENLDNIQVIWRIVSILTQVKFFFYL